MFREGLRPPDPFREADPFAAARTQDGMSLKALSALSPVLVVCLGGRRMLRALAEARADIEERRVRIALVHAGDDAEVARALERFGLQYVARIGDPEHRLRETLGLSAMPAGVFRRPRMEAGAFLVVDGEVRAGGPGEQPDFSAIAGS